MEVIKQADFFVLDRLDVRHDVLDSRLKKIAKTASQLETKGDLCSLLVRQLVPHDRPIPPPVYIDGLDQLNLQKGDQVKFSQQGSIFTDCHRLVPIPVPAEFENFSGALEHKYLKQYFASALLQALEPHQIRDVYRTLSSEPLYLLFNRMYILPRIEYEAYARAHAEFNRPERLYDAEEIALVTEMLQWANLVYRRGYLPQLADFSVANPGKHAVAVEIMQQVYVAMGPDNKLVWPYRQQLHCRLLDALKTRPKASVAWASSKPQWAVLQGGGCVALGLRSNGHSPALPVAQFNHFCEGLDQHCAVVDFGVEVSPQAVAQAVAGAAAVVVINAERYSLFALLEFTQCLSPSCGLLLLEFNADMDNDTARLLTTLPSYCEFKPDAPPMDFWPQLKLEDSTLNYAFFTEEYFGADAISEYHSGELDSHFPLVWMKPQHLSGFVRMYISSRRAEFAAAPEQGSQFMFLASCAAAQQEVLTLMDAEGFGGVQNGMRCCVQSHHTQTPYTYHQIDGLSLDLRRVFNPYDDVDTRASHNLDTLRQCECLLLGECRLQHPCTFYYTTQPLQFATLSRLMLQTTHNLIVIASRENMYFPT